MRHLGARYELLGLLGKGGMGEVHRARHVGLCKEVAIKVLAPNLPEQFQVRFEREARAIARLDHPGCVRIFDHGREAGRQYIAMELLEGPTLASVLADEGQLAIPRALAITRDLVRALAHAHGRGVLHRDLKPENIILVARGAVIIDFGLAALHDAAPLTRDGMCIGSPSYLAPERLRGAPHDERADLYAVGVILYEMLAGLKPFVGATPEEVMLHALERPPRPLRATRGELPAALEQLVLRALAKDPARRFGDAEELRSALEAITEAPPSRSRDDLAAETLIELSLARSSVVARAWSWLRYGRWRWHSTD
ncbi:MAG TPA: serine/threonine-protein kinase [Kofleriaceae bacterium]|nr:serine/threonine-protein kinase [Kofleriaceae bacterium]